MYNCTGKEKHNKDIELGCFFSFVFSLIKCFKTIKKKTKKKKTQKKFNNSDHVITNINIKMLRT